MENVRHPNHPGLWLKKIRHNSPDADGYDSIGDPWWFCEEHNQWWHSFCPKCDPVLDKILKLTALIVSAIFISLYFYPFYSELFKIIF